jgi:hypothetical protein
LFNFYYYNIFKTIFVFFYIIINFFLCIYYKMRSQKFSRSLRKQNSRNSRKRNSRSLRKRNSRTSRKINLRKSSQKRNSRTLKKRNSKTLRKKNKKYNKKTLRGGGDTILISNHGWNQLNKGKKTSKWCWKGSDTLISRQSPDKKLCLNSTDKSKFCSDLQTQLEQFNQTNQPHKDESKSITQIDKGLSDDIKKLGCKAVAVPPEHSYNPKNSPRNFDKHWLWRREERFNTNPSAPSVEPVYDAHGDEPVYDAHGDEALKQAQEQTQEQEYTVPGTTRGDSELLYAEAARGGPREDHYGGPHYEDPDDPPRPTAVEHEYAEPETLLGTTGGHLGANTAASTGPAWSTPTAGEYNMRQNTPSGVASAGQHVYAKPSRASSSAGDPTGGNEHLAGSGRSAASAWPMPAAGEYSELQRSQYDHLGERSAEPSAPGTPPPNDTYVVPQTFGLGSRPTDNRHAQLSDVLSTINDPIYAVPADNAESAFNAKPEYAEPAVNADVSGGEPESLYAHPNY